MVAESANNAFQGPAFAELIHQGGYRIWICWAITWSAGVLSAYLYVKYKRTMNALDDHYDPLRTWYTQIVFLGQVWAITTGLSVAFVRAFWLFQILEHVVEAHTLCCLRDLTIELMGRKYNFIATFEGKKDSYYAVFPLIFVAKIPYLHGRFPDRWFPETGFTAKILERSHFLTRQAYYVTPALAGLQLFLIIMEDTGRSPPHHMLTLLSFMQVLSIMVAVYGVLLVLHPVWRLERLVPYNLGHKFAVIKGVVILGILQGFLIQLLVSVGLLRRDAVLDRNEFTAEVMWSSMLLAIETPLMLYFAAKYYPAEEVREFYDQVDNTIARALFDHEGSKRNMVAVDDGDEAEARATVGLAKSFSEFMRDRLAHDGAVSRSLNLGSPIGMSGAGMRPRGNASGFGNGSGLGNGGGSRSYSREVSWGRLRPAPAPGTLSTALQPTPEEVTEVVTAAAGDLVVADPAAGGYPVVPAAGRLSDGPADGRLFGRPPPERLSAGVAAESDFDEEATSPSVASIRSERELI